MEDPAVPHEAAAGGVGDDLSGGQDAVLEGQIALPTSSGD